MLRGFVGTVLPVPGSGWCDSPLSDPDEGGLQEQTSCV